MTSPAIVSVTQLMANFADACRLLVPALDFALIPWRRMEEQYDNFDRIAEALYFSLVVEPCVFHADAEGMTTARCGFHYDDPPAAYVLVNGKFRFVELATTSEPFDTAVYEQGETLLSAAEFSFVIRDHSLHREIQLVDLTAG